MKTLLKIAEMMPYLPDSVKQAVESVAKESGQKVDDMELHRHAHCEKAKTNELDPTSRKSLAYVSARTQDRDDEIVIPKMIKLDEFRKYKSVLVNHNYSLLPVGSDEWIDADDFGIKALTIHADTGEGTLANVVWHLVSQGHLNGRSIGFVPTSATKPGDKNWDNVANTLQRDWKEFDKARAEKSVSRIITGGVLLEHSFVSVPCNTDALAIVKALACEDKIIKQLGWEKVEEMIKNGKSFTDGTVNKPNPHIPGHSFTDCVIYMQDKGGYDEETAKKICGRLKEDRGGDIPDEKALAALTVVDLKKLEERSKDVVVVEILTKADEDGNEEEGCEYLKDGLCINSESSADGKVCPAEDGGECPLEKAVKGLIQKAGKEKDPHINDDGTFKGGFEGCVDHFVEEGRSEESARKLCAYIGREAGMIKGGTTNDLMELRDSIKGKKSFAHSEIKVIKPTSEIKVLYTPPDAGLIAKGIAEAVERAISRRTGKIL